MGMTVKLSGAVDVPDGDLAIIAKHLPEHVRLSRAEKGCISFDVTVDPNNANSFLVNEEFASQADFDTHQARVKSSEWGRVTAHLTRRYEIT